MSLIHLQTNRRASEQIRFPPPPNWPTPKSKLFHRRNACDLLLRNIHTNILSQPPSGPKRNPQLIVTETFSAPSQTIWVAVMVPPCFSIPASLFLYCFSLFARAFDLIEPGHAHTRRRESNRTQTLKHSPRPENRGSWILRECAVAAKRGKLLPI